MIAVAESPAKTYLGSMGRLTRKEIKAFDNRVAEFARWLNNIDKRLVERGDYELQDELSKLRDELGRFCMHLHYETCDGSGR